MNMPDPYAVFPGLPGAEIVARIEEALEREGTHNWDDVREMLITGEAQIFFNDHGAWITRICVAPRMRWLHVWLAAGQLPGVMDIQEQVEQFARTNTLARIIVTARPGWSVLASKEGWEKFGWKKHGDVMMHEVTGP